MKYPKEIPPRPNDFQPRPFSKFPPLDLRQLRTGCRDYSETEVGGKVAGVCVVCGRAACRWTVYNSLFRSKVQKINGIFLALHVL